MTGILIWKDAACNGKTGRGLRRNVLLCILRLDTFGFQSRENLAAIPPQQLHCTPMGFR